MSTHPQSLRTFRFVRASSAVHHGLTSALMALACVSGIALPAVANIADKAQASFYSDSAHLKEDPAKDVYSSLKEAEVLQVEAEGLQLQQEDAQLYWESQQKHWEEVYRIYSHDYQVSVMQRQVAEEHGWEEDVKLRQSEAEAAWAIAIDAKQKSEDAFQKAQAKFTQAQDSLVIAQTQLTAQENILAAYAISESKAAESLEKCNGLQPPLRPILMSGNCRIQEEIHTATSLRTIAAKHSERFSKEGDMENAYKWREAVNTHTRELAQLNAEQLKHRAVLAAAFLTCFAVIFSTVFFILAAQQQQARRKGESSPNRMVRSLQVLLSTMLSEELYRDMLDSLDELLKEEEVTPFILNVRLAIRLAVLLTANLKIALLDWYDPSENASISQSDNIQLNESTVVSEIDAGQPKMSINQLSAGDETDCESE